MNKIINFPNKKRDSFEKTLSEMMKEARFLEEKPIIKRGIYISNLKELEKTIKKSIFDVLVKENCQNSDYFHCGQYISSLIKKTVDSPLESFYVIDYLAKIDSNDDFYNWQKAADLCFLLCSVFTKRCDHGLMSYQTYLLIGKSLYSISYSKSRKKITYLMSDNYKTMVNVTQQALKTLSQ